MNTMQTRVVIDGPTDLRIEINETRTYSTSETFQLGTTVIENAADGTIALWSAAAALPPWDDWASAIIEVDPNRVMALSQPLMVEIEDDMGSTFALSADRRAPLILPSRVGGLVASVPGLIEFIRVRNNNPANAGANNIPMRLILLK